MNLRKKSKKAILSSLIALALSSSAAFAMPQGGTVAAGNVNGVTAGSLQDLVSGGTLNVNGNSLIDWKSFSIGQNEILNVIFSGQGGNMLINHVTGSDISQLLGTLNAKQGEGSFMLINPNGIVVGPQAQLNVGSLIMSTLDIGTDQLINVMNNGGTLDFKNTKNGVLDIQGGKISAEDKLLLYGGKIRIADGVTISNDVHVMDAAGQTEFHPAKYNQLGDATFIAAEEIHQNRAPIVSDKRHSFDLREETAIATAENTVDIGNVNFLNQAKTFSLVVGGGKITADNTKLGSEDKPLSEVVFATVANGNRGNFTATADNMLTLKNTTINVSPVAGAESAGISLNAGSVNVRNSNLNLANADMRMFAFKEINGKVLNADTTNKVNIDASKLNVQNGNIGIAGGSVLLNKTDITVDNVKGSRNLGIVAGKQISSNYLNGVNEAGDLSVQVKAGKDNVVSVNSTNIGTNVLRNNTYTDIIGGAVNISHSHFGTAEKALKDVQIAAASKNKSYGEGTRVEASANENRVSLTGADINTWRDLTVDGGQVELDNTVLNNTLAAADRKNKFGIFRVDAINSRKDVLNSTDKVERKTYNFEAGTDNSVTLKNNAKLYTESSALTVYGGQVNIEKSQITTVDGPLQIVAGNKLSLVNASNVKRTNDLDYVSGDANNIVNIGRQTELSAELSKGTVLAKDSNQEDKGRILVGAGAINTDGAVIHVADRMEMVATSDDLGNDEVIPNGDFYRSKAGMYVAVKDSTISGGDVLISGNKVSLTGNTNINVDKDRYFLAAAGSKVVWECGGSIYDKDTFTKVREADGQVELSQVTKDNLEKAKLLANVKNYKVIADIPQPEVKPEEKPAPEVKPQPEAKPEVKPAPEVKPQPEAKPEAKPAPEVKPQPEAKPEVKPTPEVKPQPEAKPEVKPTPEVKPQPETKPEVKPAPEVKPQPETKPEENTTPAVKPQPEAKPEEKNVPETKATSEVDVDKTAAAVSDVLKDKSLSDAQKQAILLEKKPEIRAAVNAMEKRDGVRGQIDKAVSAAPAASESRTAATNTETANVTAGEGVTSNSESAVTGVEKK